MGRAARVKAERRKDAQAQAWQAGVAAVVTLPQEKFAAVQHAMAARMRIDQMFAEAREEARKVLAAAMEVAGLDPRRTYRLDAAHLTAEITE